MKLDIFGLNKQKKAKIIYIPMHAQRPYTYHL